MRSHIACLACSPLNMGLQHASRQGVLLPAATYINCVYTVQFSQYFRQLGTPPTVIFPRAAREPAHNDGCDPLS
jgi:hypothetical protein